jgi:hypothetical protein
MKKVILAAAFCFFAFVSGYSQTKQESIKELFKVMQTDSLMAKTFDAIISGSMANFQGITKDSAANAASNVMMKSMMKNLKVMMKKMIDEDMVSLYDKYFTQNDINAYITFYNSPSGQKFLKVTPDLQKDLMNVMMKKYMPEIQKSIQAGMQKKE